MHGVGNGIQEIDNAEEPHEAPALKVGVEGKIHDNGGRDYADDEPGLELAPAGAGALDYIAHNGVVERIENSGGDNDGGYRTELCVGEITGEQNEGHDAAGEQKVHHVTADGAEGEHDQVSFPCFKVVHINAPIHLNYNCTLYQLYAPKAKLLSGFVSVEQIVGANL